MKYIACQPEKPEPGVISMLADQQAVKIPVGLLLQNLKYCIVEGKTGDDYKVLHRYLGSVLGENIVQELEEL